jgi:hypothetical protein
MPVQVRNDEMVDLLRPDFQGRYEPQFAQGLAHGLFESLPELRSFYPMSTADSAGLIYDHSELVLPLTPTGATRGVYNNLHPMTVYAGAQYYNRVHNINHNCISELTFYLWCRFRVAAAATVIGGKWRTASNDRHYNLNFPAGLPGVLNFSVTSLGTAASLVGVSTVGTMVANTWYFLCGRYTGGAVAELAVWLDTEKVTNVVGIPAALFNGILAPFQLCGYDGNNATFEGDIAYAALYATPHSDALIRTVYEQTRPIFGK